MTRISKIGGLAATLMMLSSIATMPLHAQELSPSHIKMSKAALASSGATDQFDLILPSVAAKVKNDIISSRPDLADSVSVVVDEETLKLAPRRGDLENEAAALYGRVFTEEELSQITTFYKSAAGQKLLKEAPIISRELGKAAKIWATGISRDLNAAVGKNMKEKGLN